MHPADHHHLAVQVREPSIIRQAAVQQPRSQAPRSSQAPGRVRSLQSEESWIDISSRNSTSSLSSVGGEETLTASHVLGDTAFQRRRRIQRSYSGQTHYSHTTSATAAVTDSSQEEYEESESEQDQVMTSSNEDLQRGVTSVGTTQTRRPTRRTLSSSNSPDAPYLASSNDEATLMNTRPSDSRLGTSFHPQPNAFTHPPASRQADSCQPELTDHFSPPTPMIRAASANAAAAAAHARPSLQAPGSASSLGPRRTSDGHGNGRSRNHTPYNMISPAHNVSVDHDAALRASLSTLLSCAAARRGVPKRDAPAIATLPASGQQIARGTLCLIPESELDKVQAAQPVAHDEEKANIFPSPNAAQTRISRPESARRKSKSPSTSPNRRRQHRSVASTRVTGVANLDSSSLSPTTLWFLGVGALFLGGAVLFTAGYIQGREVGYVEGLRDAGTVSCRGEAAADSLRGMSRRGWRSATAGASIWGVS